MKVKNLVNKLWNKATPWIAGALLVPTLGGCVTTTLEKKVTPIVSQIKIPKSYPTEVENLFSNIEGVYGKQFAEALGRIPEMCDGDFSAEDMNALNTFYEVGKKIQSQNITNAKTAIEDIVQAGEGVPNILLREIYRMFTDGSWDADICLGKLRQFGFSISKAKEDEKDLNRYFFLYKTKWKDFDDDWKKFEKQGDEALVLNKMPNDLLIKKHVEKKILYVEDRKDYAKTPEETKKSGTGDCEDMAILEAYYSEFLEKAGRYKHIKIVAPWNEKIKKGHAFVSLEKEDEKGIYVMDNLSRSIRKFNSITEAATKIAQEDDFTPTHIWAYPRETFCKNYGKFPYNESLI